MSLPLLVVVTGPPAAGKTTVAATLRARLGVPLLAKDALKETLGEQLRVQGRVESRRLGAAVFELLGALVRELLAAGVSVVAEGNFAAASRVFDELPPCRVAQVHVTAAPAVLRARLLERDPHRHPVHYDREAADEVAARTAAGDWEALPLRGALVRLDTTDGFAFDVCALLEAALADTLS